MTSPPAASGRPFLTSVETRELSRTYGSTLAFSGVSETFAAGQVTVIEGGNGAGKSTLLAVLATLLRPSAGSVWWHPFGTDRRAVRPWVGWLTHEPTVSLNLSGVENLRWAARLYQLPPARVDEVRAQLGIGGFGKRAVRTLSRGQRQRIALGRALLHQPALLLLDEPTTGLDREGVGRLCTVIRDEASRGAVVVVVSHDPGLAGDLNARVVGLGRRTGAERVALGSRGP